MSRDILTVEHRCRYCGRPGVVRWDVDLLSCRHEVCASLAYAEARRRHPWDTHAPLRTRARRAVAGPAR